MPNEAGTTARRLEAAPPPAPPLHVPYLHTDALRLCEPELVRALDDGDLLGLDAEGIGALLEAVRPWSRPPDEASLAKWARVLDEGCAAWVAAWMEAWGGKRAGRTALQRAVAHGRGPVRIADTSREGTRPSAEMVDACGARIARFGGGDWDAHDPRAARIVRARVWARALGSAHDELARRAMRERRR